MIVIYNNVDDLRVLLKSITSYSGDQLEIVVVDGGSTDQTVECIREYEEYIDYWASEPDHGIYDAMNKGVALGTGNYIWHLNAGDRMLYLPLLELTECLGRAVDVVCFEVLITDIGIFHPRDGYMLRLDNTWHHQGTLYRRESHLGYDTQFRVYADFDLNQRLSAKGVKVQIFHKVIAEFSMDGVSGTVRGYRERCAVIRKNYGIFYVLLAFLRFQINAIRRQIHRYVLSGHKRRSA